MTAPRRHSDFDVLDPSDVHPRGRASFEGLRKAYNLTKVQAGALAATNRNHHALNDDTSERSRRSMVRRCPELFVSWPSNSFLMAFPSAMGKLVAKALDEAWRREMALDFFGRWLRWLGRGEPGR